MSTERTEEEREHAEATGAFELKATEELKELEKQHEGLMQTIAGLKTSVQEWQEGIENEAKEHSQALDNIRSQLRTEVSSLRSEFEQIKQSIREQLNEDTAESTGGDATAVE